jgi:hypothetical protein
MIFAALAIILFAALTLLGYRLLSARRTRLATVSGGVTRLIATREGSLTRRKMVISLGLLAFLLVALVIQTGPAISGTVQSVTASLGLTFQGNTNALSDFRPQAHQEPTTASSRVQRISFHAAEQFDTQFQLEDWGPSACSGITMTVVMNAYGKSLRVVNLTKKEIELGVWDHNLGLLRQDGISLTATTFGFHTDGSNTRSLADIIAIANKGAPVIVGVFDYAHFPTGHYIVVSGGDDHYVNIVDSSDFNFQRMTHELFLSMWQNYSAILTPETE